MELKEKGEFGLIEVIKEMYADIDTSECEGIGDDCAVIPCSEEKCMVITTDMLVEDVHFLRKFITPYELGRKSLAVNLSDIAAMGAKPSASFLSIALPKSTEYKWVEQFLMGYKELSKQFGVALLGGDTTSSEEKTIINVTAIGHVKPDYIKRRNAAKVNDKIFVTGILGDSAQGLLDIMGNRMESKFAHIHHNPKPYVKEGMWLGEQSGVHAMMDVSDGIASDLAHILKASHKNAEVNIDMIPHNSDIKLAVTGGEDYVLLFTVADTESQKIADEYKAFFGTDIYEIGRVTEGNGKIIWKDKGVIVDPQWQGFVHF